VEIHHNREQPLCARWAIDANWDFAGRTYWKYLLFYISRKLLDVDGLQVFENFASVRVGQGVKRFSPLRRKSVNKSPCCGFENDFIVFRHNSFLSLAARWFDYLCG